MFCTVVPGQSNTQITSNNLNTIFSKNIHLHSIQRHFRYVLHKKNISSTKWSIKGLLPTNICLSRKCLLEKEKYLLVVQKRTLGFEPY